MDEKPIGERPLPPHRAGNRMDWCRCGKPKRVQSKQCGVCHKEGLRGRAVHLAASIPEVPAPSDIGEKGARERLEVVLGRLASELEERTSTKQKLYQMPVKAIGDMIATCKQGLLALRDSGRGVDPEAVEFEVKFPLEKLR